MLPAEACAAVGAPSLSASAPRRAGGSGTGANATRPRSSGTDHGCGCGCGGAHRAHGCGSDTGAGYHAPATETGSGCTAANACCPVGATATGGCCSCRKRFCAVFLKLKTQRQNTILQTQGTFSSFITYMVVLLAIATAVRWLQRSGSAVARYTASAVHQSPKPTSHVTIGQFNILAGAL
jgi:hypothetical protein